MIPLQVLRESPDEDVGALKSRVAALKQRADVVTKRSAERLNALEQALPLSRHFHGSHAAIEAWMDGLEPILTKEKTVAVDPEHLKRQQEMLAVSALHSV